MTRLSWLGLAAAALLLSAAPSGQTSGTPTIVGVWHLDRAASDLPELEGGGVDGSGRGRGDGAGRGGRGRGGPGGPMGGGFGRGRGRGGPARRGDDREALERRLDAIRNVVRPAERLTITRTESMVIVTTDQGVTTRLATDGTKVKDGSTGIERRTTWDGAALVTEISGAGPGRLTERYEVDASTGLLVVTLQPRERRGQEGLRSSRRVYRPSER